MMGWEKALLPRGVEVLDHLTGGLPLPEYADAFAWRSDAGEGPMLTAAGKPVKQASPNHKAEAWGVELARAASANNAQHFAAAKDALLGGYFPRETAALWGSEPLCPDGHGGQHLAGLMMTRLGAWISKDVELLEKSAGLIHRNAKALLAVSSPDLQVWSCGTRAPGRPVSSVATAWLRLLFGLGLGRAFDLMKNPKAGENWQHPQHLAVRALRYLMANGDPVCRQYGGQKDPHSFAGGCPLKYRVLVYRWKDGHLAVMKKPEGDKAPGLVADWVLCTYPAAKSRIEVGHDWKTPPPTGHLDDDVIEFPAA